MVRLVIALGRLLKSEAICVAVRGMSVREVNDLAVAVQRIIAGRS